VSTAALAATVRDALASSGAQVEEPQPGEFLVHLRGDRRIESATWLIAGEHSLLVEAFFMRRPDGDGAAFYRYLLERNAKQYGVHFSVDAVGDAYLVGRVPPAAVDAAEVDRLLGCVLAYSEEAYDTALTLGFGEAIRRELAWRRDRGLSTENLHRYIAWADSRAGG
jgi:Putative bacterial sensory transduction regulator